MSSSWETTLRREPAISIDFRHGTTIQSRCIVLGLGCGAYHSFVVSSRTTDIYLEPDSHDNLQFDAHAPPALDSIGNYSSSIFVPASKFKAKSKSKKCFEIHTNNMFDALSDFNLDTEEAEYGKELRSTQFGSVKECLGQSLEVETIVLGHGL